MVVPYASKRCLRCVPEHQKATPFSPYTFFILFFIGMSQLSGTLRRRDSESPFRTDSCLADLARLHRDRGLRKVGSLWLYRVPCALRLLRRRRRRKESEGERLTDDGRQSEGVPGWMTVAAKKLFFFRRSIPLSN